jgi:vacuolar-type H+-ATPase subunit C/Vma6
MPDAYPYAYAKACGITGKSFVGKRISSLAGLRSLSELDRLIFPDSYRELLGMELLSDLEKRIIARTIRQILLIVNGYDKPPELLVQMLRVYEYSDLKACLQNIAFNEKRLPALCDIGSFQTVNFSAFPDIDMMLENTDFKFLLSDELKSLNSGGTDINSIEAKLDYLYYLRLINYLPRLGEEDRMITQRILYEEIALRNCVWALRLRTYFKKSAKETENYLMEIKAHNKTGKDLSLASDALESLDFPLDSRQVWESWKWKDLLNKEHSSEHWKADPRHFQNAASQYLYQITLRNFHRSPMSISSIFCYIKLKQFEEDFLTSIAEGLALGMDSTGVFKLLEVSS